MSPWRRGELGAGALQVADADEPLDGVRWKTASKCLLPFLSLCAWSVYELFQYG